MFCLIFVALILDDQKDICDKRYVFASKEYDECKQHLEDIRIWLEELDKRDNLYRKNKQNYKQWDNEKDREHLNNEIKRLFKNYLDDRCQEEENESKANLLLRMDEYLETESFYPSKNEPSDTPTTVEQYKPLTKKLPDDIDATSDKLDKLSRGVARGVKIGS